MIYLAIQDITSLAGSVRKPTIYCKKGETVMLIRNGNPLIVATKHNIFPVLESELRKAEMTPTKLLNTIKEVSENPSMTPDKFPYTFVQGITEGKEWERDFLDLLKKSHIDTRVKTKMLEMYENSN